MLELLLAMLILNIGIFALVGSFNAGTVAVSRARYLSSATAVADKQMEIYRSMQNCAIWLDQWLMPASGTQYALDQYDYNGTSAFNPVIPYWNAGSPADQQYWVTDGMDVNNPWAQDNIASCAYLSQTTKLSGTSSPVFPLTSAAANTNAKVDALALATPPANSVKPVQQIAGPDGTLYTVYTYMVLAQPTTGSPPVVIDDSEYVKKVTVVVYDPHNATRVLAREVSTFDPTVAP